jgi:hypothetical protein
LFRKEIYISFLLSILLFLSIDISSYNYIVLGEEHDSEDNVKDEKEEKSDDRDSEDNVKDEKEEKSDDRDSEDNVKDEKEEDFEDISLDELFDDNNADDDRDSEDNVKDEKEEEKDEKEEEDEVPFILPFNAVPFP